MTSNTCEHVSLRALGAVLKEINIAIVMPPHIYSCCFELKLYGSPLVPRNGIAAAVAPT